MKKALFLFVMLNLVVVVPSFAFYLHVGQDKSEIIEAINQPNYTEEYADQYGRVEKCQWGSERVGTMLIIYFKDGKVLKFSTKGKVR